MKCSDHINIIKHDTDIKNVLNHLILSCEEF